MVSVYVTLIINNRRTIDQIPENLKDEVISELIAQGFEDRA